MSLFLYKCFVCRTGSSRVSPQIHAINAHLKMDRDTCCFYPPYIKCPCVLNMSGTRLLSQLFHFSRSDCSPILSDSGAMMTVPRMFQVVRWCSILAVLLHQLSLQSEPNK